MTEHPARLVNLPTSVRGFCYQDDDGEAYVVLNARLAWEQNRKTYGHELKHIKLREMGDPDYKEYAEE